MNGKMMTDIVQVLLIVFSAKVSLLYLLCSMVWRCYLLCLVKQNCRVFPTGGGGSPPKFSHPPMQENSPQQTPPNKNSIFSCCHYSCTIFALISYSLDTQVMVILILIDVERVQKAVFSFEKGLNCQNHSSLGSLYLVKKSPQ